MNNIKLSNKCYSHPEYPGINTYKFIVDFKLQFGHAKRDAKNCYIEIYQVMGIVLIFFTDYNIEQVPGTYQG